MGYIVCPKCGEKILLFGESKARLPLPFLGSLPLDPKLAEHCDKGTVEEYENEVLSSIAEKVLEGGSPTESPPR